MNKRLKFLVIIMTCLLVFFADLPAQDKPTDAQIVDSLFMRASSGMVMYKDEVEPSKKALIEMGAAAIPQMLTKLDSRDAREALTISDIFKGIGEIAVEPLAGRLNSRDDYVRRIAIRCLGEIGSVKAIKPLLPYAKHDDFRTRAGVMASLGLIKSELAGPAVVAGLFDNDELVATAAAVACGQIKVGIDPIALIEILDHPYYGVRYSAMNSLVQLGGISIEPLIQYMQTDPDKLSLAYSIEALGKIGSDKALKIIQTTLVSDDWEIRAFSAEAIGEIKSDKAKKILNKSLKTEIHPFVLSKIKASLDKYRAN